MLGVGFNIPGSSGNATPPAPAAGDPSNTLLGAVMGQQNGNQFQSQPGQIDWNKVAASTQQKQQQPQPQAQAQSPSQQAVASLRSPYLDSGNPFLASLYQL